MEILKIKTIKKDIYEKIYDTACKLGTLKNGWKVQYKKTNELELYFIDNFGYSKDIEAIYKKYEGKNKKCSIVYLQAKNLGTCKWSDWIKDVRFLDNIEITRHTNKTLFYRYNGGDEYSIRLANVVAIVEE